MQAQVDEERRKADRTGDVIGMLSFSVKDAIQLNTINKVEYLPGN